MIPRLIVKLVLNKCESLEEKIIHLEGHKLTFYSDLIQKVYRSIAHENYGHALRLITIIDKSLE